jgi:GGDEF domain-containing protein
MWKKISTAISILCIAVYVFAAVFAGYRIVVAVAEHRIIGEREFAGLQDVARNAGVLGLSGAELENEIRAVVLRSLALEAVIAAMSDNTSFAVERPGERVIIPDYQNSYSFNTKWKFFRPPYSAEVTVDSRTTLSLDVLTGYIDRERLSDILRETLLIILLSVTAAFLVLMLDIIVFDKKNVAPGTPENPHDVLREEPYREPAAVVPSAVAPAVREPEADTYDAPVENPESEEEPHDRKPERQQPVFDENAGGPSRMYLGLIQKLHEELDGAGEGEKEEKNPDFVLLCAEWTGNSFATVLGAKQIAEAAAGFFKVAKISAFKKGENGVFILLPGVTFKNGLKAARKFHEHILDNVAFKTAVEDFSIGLTSRTGRQIDPERLILEAEKALEKAKEDASLPIVAFKANPSKYADYLKKKNITENL